MNDIVTHQVNHTLTFPGQHSPSLLSLPASRILQTEECAALDREEGVTAEAINEAYYGNAPSLYKLFLMALVLCASCYAVINYLPYRRFVPPTPTEQRDGLVPEPDTQDEAVQAKVGELDNLLQQARYVDVTNVAAAALTGFADAASHRRWLPVWHRYLGALWQLDAHGALSRETERLLNYVPEDCDARYYKANLILFNIDRTAKYSKAQKRTKRMQAENAALLLDDVLRDARTVISDDGQPAANLNEYTRLLAEACEKTWWLGGCQEDIHPDVEKYRDRALTLYEELGDGDRKAVQARLRIHRDIHACWKIGLWKQYYRGRKVQRGIVDDEVTRLETLLAY